MQEQHAGEHLTWFHARTLGQGGNAGGKNLWLAYLLAVPLGWMGIHRLYLGRHVTGYTMMGLSAAALLIMAAVDLLSAHLFVAMLWYAVAGLVLLAAVAWEVVDLFFVPLMVHRCNCAPEMIGESKQQLGQPV